METDKLIQGFRQGRAPLLAVGATSLAAIAVSLYCLSSGWTIIFQNLFYIPIIIACICYAKKGFAFSVALSLFYFLLVAAFVQDTAVLLQAMERVAIFSVVAGVTAFLSMKLARTEELLRESGALTKAEEKLRDSEEKYSKAFQTSPYAITITRAEDGGFIEVNDAFTSIAGYTREEALSNSSVGMRLWENEADRESVVADLRAGRVVEGREYRFRTKSGGNITGLFSAHIIRLSSGPCILSSINDISERKRAEEALRESEEKYRDMIVNLSEGFYSVTLEGTLLDYNIELARILGFDPNENLVGARLPDFWQNPEDRKPYLEQFRKHGSIKNYLVAAKKRDGAGMFVEVNARLVNDRHGKPARIEGAIVDVTERIRAEEALRQSETRFREFFENAQIGMYRSKMDGAAFLDVNAKFAEILGFTREELVGQPGSIRWANPEDRGKMVQLLKKQGGRLVNYEAQVLAKNGEVRDVLASIKLRPDEGFLEGSMLDNTGRKRLEQALRLKNFVFDASIAANSIADLQGVLTEANDAFIRIWGYHARDEVVGKPIVHFLNDQNEALGIVAALNSTGTWEGEYTAKRKDGSTFNAYGLASVVRNERGNLVGYQSSVQDITDRKLAEARVAGLNEELLHKNAELEQIVYVTSHDLRSPLVNVQGFSKELSHSLAELADFILKSDVSKEVMGKIEPIVKDDIPESLKFIEISILKMDALLSGLLRLSRLGRAAIVLEKIDMNIIMDEIRKTFEFEIQQNGVTLNVSNLPPCKGDKNQVNQLFSNLLGNAIKYLDIERKGHIEISGQKTDEFVTYCVRDNGIGIAPEHQEKIFELFHRLNPIAGAGDGLGLTIVRRICDRLGGEVWVESGIGKGSRFFVSLRSEECGMGSGEWGVKCEEKENVNGQLRATGSIIKEMAWLQMI